MSLYGQFGQADYAQGHGNELGRIRLSVYGQTERIRLNSRICVEIKQNTQFFFMCAELIRPNFASNLNSLTPPRLITLRTGALGSMLPVREFDPARRRGTREAWLPIREACFCTGVAYGKHASRTGTHSRWQVWHMGSLASRMGNMLLRWRGVREACFPYGNSFLLAGVAYGKVGFPYGNHVSALAWCLGSTPRLGF